MPEELISIGDVVRLNSGSPAMTVIDKRGDDVIVKWEGDLGVNSAVFPAACVHRIYV